MKSFTISLLIFVFILSIAQAQWVQQSPGIPSVRLCDISFASESEGWTVAYSGKVYHTSDSGFHWEVQPSLASAWTAIDFANKNSGWIVGIHGWFSSTNDGGQSWDKTVLHPSFDYSSIYRLDSLQGWITGNYSYPPYDSILLIHTIDGGLNWEDISPPDTSKIHGCYFLDSLRGWAKTDNLWFTQDGGGNWVKLHQGNPNTWAGVQFHDSLHGWMSGDSLLYTNDGGITWIDRSPPAVNVDGFGKFEFYDSLHGYVMTYSQVSGPLASIWYTSDGGLNWSEVNTESNETIFHRGMDVTSSGRLWLVQYGGVIMTYTPGDPSLTYLADGPYGTYIGVEMFDTLHGYIIGHPGIIRKTSDGGKNWDNQLFNNTDMLNAITFPDPEHGWIGGYNGLLLRTTDAGHTWSDLQMNPDIVITDVIFTDTLHGWIYGFNNLSGHQLIKETNDGGMNWDSSFSSPFSGFSKMFALGSEYAWAATNQGKIYYTDNGGLVWDSVTITDPFYAGGIYFTDSLIGWFCGDSGRIFHSQDGGRHWSLTTAGITNRFLDDIVFADALHGIALAGSHTLHTRDGGNTWWMLGLPGSYQAYSISYPHPDYAWSCGYERSIYRYDWDPVGLGENLSTRTELLIYPNPADGECNIRYMGSETGYGKISIFSMEGKELRTIPILRTSTLETTYPVNLYGLDPGFYVLIMQIGKKRSNAKLVVAP